MRWMDYTLQRWRSLMAERYIRRGDALLDIGCYDGLLLTRVKSKVSYSVGVDREIPRAMISNVQDRLILSDVTRGLPFPDKSFEAIAMLAVFEHLQDSETVVREISRLLRPGGRVILTVPSNQVDRVLKVLIAIGVADGMSLEEHHGYQPEDTPTLFETHGFVLKEWRRFQFGLNNLFVLEKPSQA